MKMSNREKKFLTTGRDLQQLLARCQTCNKLTNYGNYILFHSRLTDLIIPRKNKIVLIINSKAEGETEGISHWFCLCKFPSSNFLFICDGLGIVKNNLLIMKSIEQFCKNNQLTYLHYLLRLQVVQSLQCGYNALFYVYKVSTLSLKSFLALKKVMNQHSIHTNQQIALKAVKKHFRIVTL